MIVVTGNDGAQQNTGPTRKSNREWLSLLSVTLNPEADHIYKCYRLYLRIVNTTQSPFGAYSWNIEIVLKTVA